MTKAEELVLRHPVGYDKENAAIVAGVHVNTIHYALDHGHLIPVRSATGKKKIITPDELARWLDWREARKTKNK